MNYFIFTGYILLSFLNRNALAESTLKSRFLQDANNSTNSTSNNSTSASQAQQQSTPSSNQAQSGGTSNDFMTQILNEHNKRRSSHSAPPLTISEEAVQFAQNLAQKCASMKKLEHTPPDPNKKFGENLYFISGKQYQPGEETQAWYQEKELYTFGSDFSQETGHFTQLVWIETTQLGCGQATEGNSTYVACAYYPAGNVQSQFAQNVKQENGNNNTTSNNQSNSTSINNSQSNQTPIYNNSQNNQSNQNGNSNNENTQGIYSQEQTLTQQSQSSPQKSQSQINQEVQVTQPSMISGQSPINSFPQGSQGQTYQNVQEEQIISQYQNKQQNFTPSLQNQQEQGNSSNQSQFQ